MAPPKGGTSADKQGKKPHRNKLTGKKYSHYINGVKKGKCCPRCGPGTFLGNHKDGRVYCGKCHYTEFSGKNSE